jgi:hypothetical protein
MAQNKIFNFEPAAISSSTLATVGGNLFCCLATPAFIGLAAAAPYAIVKHIRVNNILTTAAITVSLFKGLFNTGSTVLANTFALSSVSIPAASYVDWYGQARFDSTDYLTGCVWGLTSSSAVLTLDGEIGIA